MINYVIDNHITYILLIINYYLPVSMSGEHVAEKF